MVPAQWLALEHSMPGLFFCLGAPPRLMSLVAILCFSSRWIHELFFTHSHTHVHTHTYLPTYFHLFINARNYLNTQNLRGLCISFCSPCINECVKWKAFLRAVCNGEVALSIWVVIMPSIWIALYNVQNMFTFLCYRHLLKLGLLGSSSHLWIHRSPAGIVVVPGGSSDLEEAFIVLFLSFFFFFSGKRKTFWAPQP